MERQVSLEKALCFTKLSVYLACSWPPSRTATKWETTKYHIAWCLSFLSALCLFVPLLMSISKYHSNSFIIAQSITYILIQEMEDFIKNAQPQEVIVLQRYMDQCSGFHFFISVLNYLTTVTIICTPLLFHDHALPTYAVYPFSVETGIFMFLAYLHQSFAGFQCSSGITIDCQAAVMLWFAGARLEILADELKYVSDVEGLKVFVRKHRKLLDYAIDVSNTMAYIALASSMSSGVAAITSSLQLFGNQSLFVKIQFGPVAIIAAVNLFICTWPADNLIHVCKKLENTVYSTSWMDMPLKMMKYIPLILQRCQRPVTVSVGGFLPTLSFTSYASFLWVLFSYFTTLRLVLMADEEK